MKIGRKSTAIIILALTVIVVGIFVKQNISPASARQAQSQQVKYHCPMHPNFVSDEPGDCAICGMKLVPTESERRLLLNAQ